MAQLNSQAQQDADELAQVAELAWDALKNTSIPGGQQAEATAAMIHLMGLEYFKDRTRYFSDDANPGPVPPNPVDGDVF